MSNKADLAIIIPPATEAARIWSAGRFRDDPWRDLVDGAPWPTHGSVIVSIERWYAEGRRLAAANGLNIGVTIAAGQDLTRDDLGSLKVIVLSFPKFTDGRAYSIARRLREQWGYRGELRAGGDVLYDQLPLMLRCGFDSFSITDAATIAELQRAGLPLPERMYQSPIGVSNAGTAEHQREHALAAAE